MKRVFRLSDSRSDPGRDVRDEIRFHLEMRARELAAQGMSPEEARRAAAASFGDVSGVEAECRAERERWRRERWWRDWWRGARLDLLVAVRTLRTRPAFAAAAALTLALGIGATAAVFTVVNGVLLRPLPYRDPARLTMVWVVGRGTGPAPEQWPLSAPFFTELQEESRAFTALGAFRASPYTLGDVAEPEQVAGARVTPSVFATLGVPPHLGRVLEPADAAAGAAPVAVISHALWARRFGGSSAVLGRGITLSGKQYTIVGVMPEGFAFPRGAELPAGLEVRPRTDVWTPLVFGDLDRSSPTTLNLAVIGRLAPGVTPGAAAADLDAIARRFAARFTPNAKHPLALFALGLREQAAAPVRRGLLILMGAVALVLLIACVNVVNLLLARTVARQRELALRTALGASPARLARQLVTENLVLGVAGAALGVLLAIWGSRAMLALVPGSLPRADDVRVDLRVIGAALLLALAAGTVFGIATAMFGTRRRLAESLHGASARTTGDIGRRFGRRLLVSAEVALSLVLLVGATLLGVSFARLQRVAPGFVPEHAVSAQVTLPVGDVFDPARDGPRWAATFAALVQRLGAVPGVRAVGAVSSLPLSGAEESGTFEVEGRPLSPGEHGPSTEYAVIEGDYFDAMGIRLLEGRAFDGRDRAGGEPVVVVSRALARSAFPGESAIGKRIRGGFDFVSQWRTIVGVVDDVRQTSLDAAPSVTAYVPESQMSYPGLTIVARTRGAPATVIPGMRRALRALDPTLAFAELRPLEDVLTDSLARQRFSMAVLAAFAAAALALAVVGLYGVIALSVGQRTREIGIRMALGARAADVLRLVLGEGLRLTVGGIAGGVLVSLALTRVLRSLLFDTSPLDPGAYLAAIAGVTVVALLATYLPARRATRVDPTVALGE